MEFSAVTGAISNLTSVMNTVLDTIAGNALLLTLLVVPVVGAGCAVFKKLVRASKA